MAASTSITTATPVEIRGLTKSFGATPAVTELDLEVAAGQVFGFLGPNGAGKTTTIRLLLALQRPTAGRMRVLGLEPGRDGLEIHRRVGYLPGDLVLFPRLTGRQHLERFAHLRGMRDTGSGPALAARFQADLDRPVRELSKGNRQKLGLVLAFMHEPELVILDEPTSGLDPLMQDEFERLARQTAEEGRTVFLSSHELDEVQRVADRVAIIKAGRLVATDTVEGLRRAAPLTVEVRFGGPVERRRLESLDGVTVAAWDGDRGVLEVTGPIGPVLRVVAAMEPVDFLARHANLDELFLDFYREARP